MTSKTHNKTAIIQECVDTLGFLCSDLRGWKSYGEWIRLRSTREGTDPNHNPICALPNEIESTNDRICRAVELRKKLEALLKEIE